MREGPLELYQALLSDSESALAQALDARNSGEFVHSQSVMRSREIVEEMEFCRGATDLGAFRGRLLARSYWVDAFAVERIHVLLNVKAIVISIGAGGGYVITQEVVPNDVVFFEPDLYFVVRLAGAHYELMADESGKTAFQYAEIPHPIRACLRPAGFYSAIPDILRGFQLPQNVPPEVETVGSLPIRQQESARRAASRANARDTDPRRLSARVHREPNPERHFAGMMENPCDHCGALRWDGELTRTTMCCKAGMVKLPDIQDPPEPLLSLLKGTHEYASDFQKGARDLNALLSFASIGADVDAGAVGRGSYVYRIRGTMYHRFGSIEPEDGAAPRYAQIYLFDTEEATEFREAQAMNKVRSALLSDLHVMLGKCNPFPRLFTDCAARMRKDGRENMRLILRADGAEEDSRRYNLPLGARGGVRYRRFRGGEIEGYRDCDARRRFFLYTRVASVLRPSIVRSDTSSRGTRLALPNASH